LPPLVIRKTTTITQGWEELMAGVAEVEAVLALDCPEEVLISRLLKRGETSGRTDDNVETARKRFHTYNEAVRPCFS
jgi:adenylate kinase family enzyme